MANNCLVTKLNGVVDNNNLDVFNSITFEKFVGEAGISGTQILVNPASFIEVVEGNGHLYDVNDNDIGTSATTTYVKLLSEDTAKIRIHRKYSVELLVLEKINKRDISEDIKYLSPNLRLLALRLPDILRGGLGMHGSIDELPTYANLQEITLLNGGEYQINIESVPSKFPSLTTLDIFMNNSTEGDFVEMVKRYVQGGRTTGTINMFTYNWAYVPSRHLKFNGEEFGGGDYLNMNLTWSTESGTTTVTLTSTNRDTLTAVFTL